MVIMAGIIRGITTGIVLGCYGRYIRGIISGIVWCNIAGITRGIITGIAWVLLPVSLSV